MTDLVAPVAATDFAKRITSLPDGLLDGIRACRTTYAAEAMSATWKLFDEGWNPIDVHPDDFERYVALHEGPQPWTERLSGRLLDSTGPPDHKDLWDRLPSVCAVGWCGHDDHEARPPVSETPTPAWMLTPHRFAERWSVESGSWPYEASAHHRLVGERLAITFQRGGGRIRISLPSQVGKSATVSYAIMLGFVWSATSRLITSPARDIVISYEQTLAASFGREIRNQFEEVGNLLGITLRRDSTAASRFAMKTVHGDMTYTAAGAQGSITGRPASQALVIDDAHKGWVDAHSKLQRDTVHNTFRSAARTRVHPGAAIILIGTRFHQDDLLGRVAADDSGDYEVLVIPAIAEEDDLLGREEGEPLWEESGRDRKFWADLANDLGPYLTAAILQGNPTNPDGEMFKRDSWVYAEAAPPPSNMVKYVRRWDLAASTKAAADETVGALIARDSRTGFAYIIDVVHKRLDTAGVEDLIEDTAVADRDRYGKRVMVRIEQEPGASGKGWPDSIIRTRLAEFDALAIPSRMDKYERMRPFAAAVTRGHAKIVMIDGRAPQWAELLIDQAAGIPTGTHDDIIDAVNLGHMDLVDAQPKAKKARASTAARANIPSSQ
jgi:predicted phage terminase large subunit-like protein